MCHNWYSTLKSTGVYLNNLTTPAFVSNEAFIFLHRNFKKRLSPFEVYRNETTNRPVSQRFFPLTVSSPNNVYWLISYITTVGCIAIFHKHCCYTKHAGIITDFTLRNHWGILLMCQNITMWVYGAWIKYVSSYVKKHIVHLAMCYNPPIVRDKPLGAPAFVKLVYNWY